MRCNVRETKQVCRNISANEMENAWRYDYLKKDGDYFNPFNRSVVVNCVEAFWRPLVQQLTKQGYILGDDGAIRSSPSAHFPDYYKVSCWRQGPDGALA